MYEETDRDKDQTKNCKVKKRPTWYLNPNCPSPNSILPPIHSVTLKPSSFNSPVNSRLTPPKREPHAEWILKLDVSSVMILLKCLVLSPEADVCVLDRHEMSVTKERWARRKREKDGEETSQESGPSSRLPQCLVCLQSAKLHSISGHRHKPHACGSTEERVGQFTTKKWGRYP